MKHKPKHVLEYVQLRMAAGLVRMLPLRAGLSIGWLIAAASHFIARVHVDRTRQRVRQVLGPEAPEKQVRHVAWIAWRNLIFNGVDALRFSMLTTDKVRKMPLAHLEEQLKTILRECNGGFILATPHMGNWEMAGVAADLLDIPIFVIVRKQKNPLVNEYLNQMRRTFNMEVLLRESKIWKSVADRLKQGKVLAILPDINSRAKGITVNYLNGKATIAAGAAHFAQLAGCPIYPIFVRRIGWVQHTAELAGPILPNPAAEKNEDQQRIMQEIMTTFSDAILKTPEQYFWHNKRWVLNPE